MCLSKVEKGFKVPKGKTMVGYKVMQRHWADGSLRGACYPGEGYDIGKEYKATDEILLARSGGKYKSGFHFYPSKKTALLHMSNYYTFVVVKCRFSEIVAKGKEWVLGEGKAGERVCYVAKKMTILEEVGR